MLSLLFTVITLLGTQVTPVQSINATLDDFHDAAAKADGPRYFAHFAEAGVFIGTDATERWTVAEFKAYAAPHFAKGAGWTYTSTARHIQIGPGGKVAWFDERLHNTKYGETRGSGVLIIERGRWRIAQYVLSFPIPNDRAAAVLRALKGPAQPD